MRALCLFVRHKRSDNVWYDGVEFRASCRRCGTPLLKDGISGRWRTFDQASDYMVERQPHP